MAVPYERFAHGRLAPILGLDEDQGSATRPADPARASRALTAPGVTTVAVLDVDDVARSAALLSDGAIDADLSALLVAAPRRREGISGTLLDVGDHRPGRQARGVTASPLGSLNPAARTADVPPVLEPRAAPPR
jgi:hypothetical protein